MPPMPRRLSIGSSAISGHTLGLRLKEGVTGGDEDKDARTVNLCGVVVIGFFWVAGGIYGNEELIGSGPPGIILWGLVLAGILYAFPFALMCAELASAYPENGGIIVPVREALGMTAANYMAYLNWVINALDASVYPLLAATYIKDYLPDWINENVPYAPKLCISYPLIVMVTCFNLFGLNWVVRFSNVIFVCALSPCLIYLVWGFAYGKLALDEFFNFSGNIRLSLSVSWMIWLYSGFVSLGMLAGEVKDPQRTFLGSVLILVPLTVCLNISPVLVSLAQDDDTSHYEAGYFETLASDLAGEWLKYGFIIGSMAAYIGLYNSQVVSAQEAFAFIIEANLKQQVQQLNFTCWRWMLPIFLPEYQSLPSGHNVKSHYAEASEVPYDASESNYGVRVVSGGAHGTNGMDGIKETTDTRMGGSGRDGTAGQTGDDSRYQSFGASNKKNGRKGQKARMSQRVISTQDDSSDEDGNGNANGKGHGNLPSRGLKHDESDIMTSAERDRLMAQQAENVTENTPRSMRARRFYVFVNFVLICVFEWLDYTTIVEAEMLVNNVPLFLLCYSFIHLRITQQNKHRPFEVPGGIIGACFVVLVPCVVLILYTIVTIADKTDRMKRVMLFVGIVAVAFVFHLVWNVMRWRQRGGTMSSLRRKVLSLSVSDLFCCRCCRKRHNEKDALSESDGNVGNYLTFGMGENRSQTVPLPHDASYGRKIHRPQQTPDSYRPTHNDYKYFRPYVNDDDIASSNLAPVYDDARGIHDLENLDPQTPDDPDDAKSELISEIYGSKGM